MADDEQNITQDLNNYYKLKTEYKESLDKKKNIIKNLKEISWKEKHHKFNKLKFKCITCKRPIGTIFSTKLDKDTGERHLIAICGDRKSPCPLNINIQLGISYNCSKSLNDDEKTISNYKKEVIIDKNNLLFGYISSDDAVNKFDVIKKEISEIITFRESTIQLCNNISNDPQKKKELEQLQVEFYSNVNIFKSIMTDFDKDSSNTQLVNDAVELYIKMIPKLKSIMDKRFSYSNVEYEDDEKYHLVQKFTTIEDNEFVFGEQKVIKFVVGMEYSGPIWSDTDEEKSDDTAYTFIRENKSFL